ncbi:hypothetical protein EMIT0P218_80204 [Pseudomonas sp. IT-P218]
MKGSYRLKDVANQPIHGAALIELALLPMRFLQPLQAHFRPLHSGQGGWRSSVPRQ